MKRALIGYYGGFQALHILAIAYGFATGMEKMMLQVSPILVGTKFHMMNFSSLLDLCASAPLGVLFAWGYFQKKPWASGVGIMSLTLAVTSVVFSSYVLAVYEVKSFSIMNTVLALAYVPAFVLFGWTLVGLFQGRYILDSTSTK